MGNAHRRRDSAELRGRESGPGRNSRRKTSMVKPDRERILDALSRIEGQVRGVARMVREERYCADTLEQMRSVMAALRRVENLILRKHMQTCVRAVMESGDARERDAKIEEIMTVLSAMSWHG